MRQNISPTPISAAPNAARQRLFPSSTARTPQQRGVGRGIAIVLNAGGPHAPHTAPLAGTSATPAFARGVLIILRLQQRTTSALGSSENMDCQKIRLKRCVPHSMENVPFVSAPHPDYSWTIATRRAMRAPFSVRRATRSSVGTSARPIPFCGSSDTSTRTTSDRPCHADVLLEIANRPVSLSLKGEG